MRQNVPKCPGAESMAAGGGPSVAGGQVWLPLPRAVHCVNALQTHSCTQDHTHSAEAAAANSSPAAEPAKPKTKAAAKNAKRKEKRLAEPGSSSTGGGAAAVAAAVQGLSLGGGSSSGGGGGAAQAPAAPAAAAAAAEEEEPSIEKQIRTLKKKMRQAEALAEKRGAGQALSPEEEAKLSRLPGWQEELRQLEAQL